MQIIFLLIEIFLPDIAAKLGSGDAKILRTRFLHVGYGLMLLALLVLLVAGCLQVYYYQLPLKEIDLLTGGPFTAFVLFVTGIFLIFMSCVGPANPTAGATSEKQEDSDKIANNSANNIADIWSRFRAAQRGRISQNPQKLKSIQVADCLDGTMPNEAWMFFVGGRHLLVVNNLDTGCQLWAEENLLDQNILKTRFGSDRTPRLSANVSGVDGKQYEVAVFFQVRLHIKLRISINGKWLNEKFI